MSHSNKQLSQILDQTRLNSLVTDAHIIRNWPIDQERNAEAARMVQHVRTRYALRDITEQQYQTVLSLLSVVENKPRDSLQSAVNDEQAACDAFGNTDCCGQ